MENIQTQTINTLAKLAIGETARVESIAGDTATSRRLMEMGVMPGVSVKMIKSAPFGCPVQISVKGYHLAIRRSEAEMISIKK